MKLVSSNQLNKVAELVNLLLASFRDKAALLRKAAQEEIASLGNLATLRELSKGKTKEVRHRTTGTNWL